MWKCLHCNTNFSFTEPTEKANHSRWCAKNPKNNKHGKQISCIRCGISLCWLNIKDRKTTCSKDCQYSHIESTKQVLSEKRKQYLRENPDKHVWKRSNKFRSKPCENVKHFLSSRNVHFVEEYSPSKERHYSIDIAFPDIRFGIEINGNQHYTQDGALTEYYQERHNFLKSLGWNIVEIHYSKCFSTENIEKLLDFQVIAESKLDDYTVQKYLKYKNSKPKRSRTEANRDRHKSLYEYWESNKNLIFEYNIDFSKYGWAGKVSSILGILPQKVNKWMKRYHPEFYNNNCFKRSKIH